MYYFWVWYFFFYGTDVYSLNFEWKTLKPHVQTALISHTALASRPLSPAWPKNSTKLSYWKTTFHKRLTKARKQTWGREEGVWSYGLLYELIISKTFLIFELLATWSHQIRNFGSIRLAFKNSDRKKDSALNKQSVNNRSVD